MASLSSFDIVSDFDQREDTISVARAQTQCVARLPVSTGRVRVTLLRSTPAGWPGRDHAGHQAR